MTEQPDHYKERELKYKRLDVYFRAIAAIAAVFSAIAAFPILKNALSSASTSVQKSSTATPPTPRLTSQPPSSAATGFTPSTPSTPSTPGLTSQPPSSAATGFTPSIPSTPSTPGLTSQPPSSAATGFTLPTATPTTPAAGFIQSNQKVQQLPQVAPSKSQTSLQLKSDHDDDDDDRQDNDDKRNDRSDDDD